MSNAINTVTSKDGTPIAYERFGDGPPIILVVGAFNERATGVPLATALASDFSAYTYDRRGRGASGDTTPYAVEREIDDLEALIVEAGRSAAVFGYSSGAALALRAAAAGLAMSSLVLYDLPWSVDSPQWDHTARLAGLIEAGRRGDAVEYYQAELVGIPQDVVAQLRDAPFRPALEAIAHTLVYDATILGDGHVPGELPASVAVPTLAIAGGAGVPFMRETASALADALPNGRSLILEGQTHDINPSVLAPPLREFLSEPRPDSFRATVGGRTPGSDHSGRSRRSR
jgi:pimeloyl-ACP methyl ester carboxylesterase